MKSKIINRDLPRTVPMRSLTSDELKGCNQITPSYPVVRLVLWYRYPNLRRKELWTKGKSPKIIWCLRYLTVCFWFILNFSYTGEHVMYIHWYNSIGLKMKQHISLKKLIKSSIVPWITTRIKSQQLKRNDRQKSITR